MKEIINNGKYISYLSRVMLKHSHVMFEEFGLSAIEYQYLMILKDKDKMTQKELSKDAMVDKAQTARAVKTLLDKKLVYKDRCESDKRITYISLTNLGKELAPKVYEKILLFEETLHQGIDISEQRTMKKNLIKMIRNLRDS